ncbi:uncharacterized protein LOC121249400 [Juglans microcarpa x Juglans regia]|uniref:uncharacterized protein LOC121249400 n=1 Tax=Juglans microcarpa x Juglans regia TaxID=2249226 RepID=UPI001B7DED64|nr:uncharacterized protein LOC121249400 [Juglans microcarpa x Juglans regia]
MGIEISKVRPSPSSLKGFSGDAIQLMGTITLPVMAGKGLCAATTMIDFLVVKAPSSNIPILGRMTLNSLKAVTSTYHHKMKSLIEAGVREVQGKRALARECYV